MLTLKDIFYLLMGGAIVVVGMVFAWQDTVTLLLYNVTAPETIFCAQDVKICESGGYVQRVPPSCQFGACPSAESTSGPDTSD